MKFTAQWQKQFSQFIRNTMNWQYAFTTSTALSAFVYQYYQEKNHLPHSITSSNQKKSDLRIIDNNNFANSHFYSAFFYFYAFCLLDFLHPNKKFTTYALTGFTSALLLSLDARYTKLVDPKCVNTHHYFDQFASLSVYSATLLSPAMPFGAFLLLLELNQLHQKMLFKKYFDVNFDVKIQDVNQLNYSNPNNPNEIVLFFGSKMDSKDLTIPLATKRSLNALAQHYSVQYHLLDSKYDGSLDEDVVRAIKQAGPEKIKGIVFNRALSRLSLTPYFKSGLGLCRKSQSFGDGVKIIMLAPIDKKTFTNGDISGSITYKMAKATDNGSVTTPKESVLFGEITGTLDDVHFYYLSDNQEQNEILPNVCGYTRLLTGANSFWFAKKEPYYEFMADSEFNKIIPTLRK